MPAGHSPPYPSPQPFHPASSVHLSGLRPHITSSKQSSHCSSLGGDSPLNTGFTLLTVSSLSSSLCVSPTRQRSVSKAGANSVLVNEVFLEHSHVYSWTLLSKTAFELPTVRNEQWLQRSYGQQSLKDLLSGPLLKKFAVPCSRPWVFLKARFLSGLLVYGHQQLVPSLEDRRSSMNI